MKKLIAFLLCLTLLCMPVAFAEEGNSSGVLKALNIGNFSDAEGNITRGQFIGAVSDILNYNSRPVPCDGIFSDATSIYEYSGAIYDAYGRGIISGYSDGTFGTKSPIIYGHAVKILVSALGYDNLAAASGGYPSGYMTVASQKGILKGVPKKADDTLNADEAARLIENAMDTDVFQQVIFGDETAGYESVEGETLLKVYAKIRKIKGFVSDNGITALEGNSATKAGNVIIDGIAYESGKTMAAEFLGYKVEAYVTCDSEVENKVLYIEKADIVKTLEIPADRLMISNASFTAKNIVYEDVYGKETKATVDGVADFIYNGKAYTDLKGEDLKINIGKLLLVDNNSDNVYDVVFVDAMDVFVALGVSVESETIYKKGGASLPLSKCKSIEVYRDGVKASLEDIVEWDVVSAGMSVDKTAVTLRVSSKKISGEVDSISAGDKTISVNGKYYRVLTDNLISKIAVGAKYEFCLDESLNIAGIKSENQNDKYVGIVTGAAEKEGVEKGVQVRIFSSLGNFDILTLADRAVVDGNSSMTAQQKINYINENMKDNLVSCKMDGSGKIMDISLPYTTQPGSHQNAESLRVDYGDADKGIYCYGTAVKNFEGKVVPNALTAVFILPQDRNEYDSYSVTDMSYFQHSTLHNILAYSIGEENGYSEYIIRIPKAEEAYTNRHIPLIVSKVVKVLNDEGMEVEQVTGFNTSGEVSVFTKYDGILSANGVKAGDIIRYKTDVNERIIEVERIIDGETATQITKIGENYGSSPRLMLYDVYYRYDTLVGCTTYDLSKPFNEATVKAGILKQTIPSWIPVYEVDTKNGNKITKSSHNAIRDYLSVGTERSKLFMYTYSGGENMAVIYN